MFKAKKPCTNCPFKKSSLKNWIRKEHSKEIIKSLKGDAPFFCHKHVNYEDESFQYDVEDSHSEYKVSENDQFCAGALILMKKENILFDNLSTRLGIMGFLKNDLLEPDKFLQEESVFETIDEFISHHNG